jgi:hypothetical protein
MATMEAPVLNRTRPHVGPFVNEPLTDFTREDNARLMRAAVAKVRNQLGREYDLIMAAIDRRHRTRSSRSIRRNRRS